MYFKFPFLIQRATVALVAGNANVQVVPAPGVNWSVRVIGWSLYCNRSIAAAVVDLDLDDNGVAGIFAQARGLQLTGKSGAEMMYGFPGYQLANNAQVRLVTNSTVAAGNAIAIVYYYIDTVT